MHRSWGTDGYRGVSGSAAGLVDKYMEYTCLTYVLPDKVVLSLEGLEGQSLVLMDKSC